MSLPESEKKSSLLIIDPDLEFLTDLRGHVAAKQCPPLIASSAEAAVVAIDKWRDRISGVLVNPAMDVGASAPSIINRVLRFAPQAPIFFLCNEGEHRYSKEDLQFMMVRQVISRTSDFSQILKAINAATALYNPEEALNVAARFHDVLNKEIESSEEQFSPIVAANFMSGSIVHFDVYVRLGEKRFVKILQAGDAFSPERLAKYLDKGVKHFFIRKAAQESYLKFCQVLASGLLLNSKVPISVKTTATLNQGEETIHFLKNVGVQPAALGHAKVFVNQVQRVLEIDKMMVNPDIQRFLEDAAMHEHGVAVLIISSLLLKPLEFSADRSVNIIGLSSLLHDIALTNPKFGPGLDVTKLTAEERAEWEAHPLVGARMVAALNNIEPVIVQAIEQHHERRTRTGFPKKIGFGEICQVAEIVGIADEFADLMALQMANKLEKGLSALAIMEERVLADFSSPVVDSFRKAFGGKEED